jgi:hypothetical protein
MCPRIICWGRSRRALARPGADDSDADHRLLSSIFPGFEPPNMFAFQEMEPLAAYKASFDAGLLLIATDHRVGQARCRRAYGGEPVLTLYLPDEVWLSSKGWMRASDPETPRSEVAGAAPPRDTARDSRCSRCAQRRPTFPTGAPSEHKARRGSGNRSHSKRAQPAIRGIKRVHI